MASIKLDRFLNSQKFAASVFLITGANKTYKDYKNADDKYKIKFLIKDTAILAGAGAGMALQKKYTPKITDIKSIKKFVDNLSEKLSKTNIAKKFQKPLDFGREVVTDTLKNVSMFASGILGALAVDLVLSHIKSLQPKPPKKETETTILDTGIDSVQNVIDKGVDKVIVNDDVKNAMYESITDMPQLQILTSSLAGTNAIDLAKETELKTKLKHTGKCLIYDSLLPMLYLAIANILTKNLTSYKKVFAVFGILVTSTLITTKLTELRMSVLSKKNLNKYLNKLNFLQRTNNN